MALTLRVTSYQHQALGEQSVKTFGDEGGTIGRKPDNEWVLPDPERFISGYHARIACRSGTFYIVDTSANGTFVNGSPEALGKGHEQLLHDGDELHIGEYAIGVSLEPAAQSASAAAMPYSTGHSGDPEHAAAPGTSGPDPFAAFAAPASSNPAPGAAQDFGQPNSVDPLDFFSEVPDAQPGASDYRAESDHGSSLEQFYEPPPVEPAPIEPAPVEPAPPPSAAPDAGMIPEDWDKTGFDPPKRSPGSTSGGSSTETPDPFGPESADPFESLEPPAPQQSPPESPGAQAQGLPSPEGAKAQPPPAAEPEPPTPPPHPGGSPPSPAAPSSDDAANAMTTLLQAAGMDAASARAAAASPALPGTLGMLVSVVIQGMLDVLKARAEIKSQFRVPVTMMKPVENNPLKFSATPAQALENLLEAQNQAYLEPVDAFTEGFEDIKAHQVAMMAGMRAAFDSMISRFDPDELVERFDKQLKRGSLLNMPGKGRYWDMYRDLYEELMRDSDSNFQRLFGDEFAKAYEEQMRRLTTRRH